MSANAAPAVRDRTATCAICPHACTLAPGQVGACRAWENRGGVVVARNYGRVTSVALDPIEKKPLARFRPGMSVLSVGSYGCNLRCPFCQNASIAQAGEGDVGARTMMPDEVVALAASLRDRGNVGIAYTYNEPLVGFEFVRDCARLAHAAGLVNVLVSNGMVNPGPLGQLEGLIDAVNIDLKGFDQEFYDFVGGDFATVRATIETIASWPNCHVEVTTLVVPGRNDDAEAVDAATAWLASLSPEIPYHLTRFFPRYRMADASPTPVRTVHALADVARRHLRHVYVGNC